MTVDEQTRAIIHSRAQWMAIIDAITDYIFVIDEHRRLVKVNSAFAARLGVHPRDLIGRPCNDVFGAEISSGLVCPEPEDHELPRTYEKIVGDDVFQISIFPLREDDQRLAIHVMKNVTEVKRLKDQLYHADKLASIGLLVSGVAHEINNPLTGTIAYTELLAMKTTDESVRQELKKILDSAERCKKIVDNLLTFSRQRTPSKSIESINDIIDRAVDLRNYWLRSGNIKVERKYDPVSTVFVDAQQIQQVMLNVLLNAEQAITGAGIKHGVISFTTRFDKERRVVIITIVNNGPSIPQQIVRRIFDPFFTTKPVGIGTGLGLSIAHGIATEHEGSIAVENREGGGVAVTIELPTGIGGKPAER